ncbi:glycosyltransferase family 4 protein [Oceanibaculum indicum]|uniref:Glycosyltransferase involved in cell wall biosynthesis n=1 Tax=Oceanibaculum indicum TaxID=526216 RepID=A0A420WQY6_9PROT|nr:glycosyltransferase family 4 protein [Oceanibaculum indicum]RKQ73400.1 glycosyltransferase involved in cell wall biosynthesis [Oceanibaculum indicum]
MSSLHFLLPGNPDTRTGGYLYDARISAGLETLGWAVLRHRLADSFPFPGADDLGQAADILASLPDDALVLIDGLALGVLPAVIAPHTARLRLAALVHHPLAEETGLDEAARHWLFESEKAALAMVRHTIVTSPFTATALAPYGVPQDRVTVILPGTDPAPVAQGSGNPGLHILTVGTLTPRKGHDVLLTALGTLLHHDWTLTLAGGARDKATADLVEKLIQDKGLSDRVTMVGEVDGAALAALYDRADLFALASHYEGYGMVFAEALARGLPVLGTTGGAIPTTVPPEAGLLVSPGDAGAFAEALERVMTDNALRQTLRYGALKARDTLPRWPDQARAFAKLLETL